MMKIFCDSNGIKYNGDKISLSLDPKTAHDGINFTSHAHMDHLPSARSAGTVLCTHETMEIAKIRNRDIQNSIQHYDGTEMIDSGHILGGRGLLFDDVKFIPSCAVFGSRLSEILSPLYFMPFESQNIFIMYVEILYLI